MFAALLTAALVPPPAPKPAPPPAVRAYTTATSDDGKHAVRLLTVSFPYTDADAKLLGSIMNSDPYWHHFREGRVYLRVGDAVFAGGPRITTNWEIVIPKVGDPPPGWTVSFALPAGVKLAGAELRFCGGVNTAKGGPAEEPFATVKVTAEELKKVATPLRAEVRFVAYWPTGTVGDKNLHHGRFVAFNHLPPPKSFRAGDQAFVGYTQSMELANGANPPVGWRYCNPDEYGLTFRDEPAVGAKMAVEFRGIPGWYTCETTEKLPEKK